MTEATQQGPAGVRAWLTSDSPRSRLQARAAAVVLVAGLGVVAAFTLARNLPLGAWLAP